MHLVKDFGCTQHVGDLCRRLAKTWCPKNPKLGRLGWRLGCYYTNARAEKPGRPGRPELTQELPSARADSSVTHRDRLHPTASRSAHNAAGNLRAGLARALRRQRA